MYGTRAPLLFQQVSKFPTRLFFKVFHNLDIQGLENLKSLEKSGVILASNHISDWDPVLISATLPVWSPHMPLFFVSREKTFYEDDGTESLGKIKQYIYGGAFFRLMGAYPAVGGIKDYEKSLHHHLSILNENKTVCIFPSGKIRTGEKDLDKTKGGVGFLAQKTGRTVIPVGIKRQGRSITVIFGTPLEYKDIFNDGEAITADSCKVGARVIMAAVENLLS
ncbi:MAG: lysophospholipid acyltransferase family protein [Candidatus Paceibacterota bacterium]